MNLWTQSYHSGEAICAICGAPRNGRASCCPVAPKVSFSVFVSRYFGVNPDTLTTHNGERLNHSTAREFYDDYRHSDSRSLDE